MLTIDLGLDMSIKKYYYIVENDLDFLELLFELGHRADGEDVALAAARGKFALAEVLLDHGGTVSQGHLEYLAEKNYWGAVKWMVDHGGKVGEDFVYQAALKNNFDLADFFLRNGGQLASKDLDLVFKAGNVNAAEWMLGKGVLLDKSEASNPLQVASLAPIAGYDLTLLSTNGLLRHVAYIAPAPMVLRALAAEENVGNILTIHNSAVQLRCTSCAVDGASYDQTWALTVDGIVNPTSIENNASISYYLASTQATAAYSFFVEANADCAGERVGACHYGENGGVALQLQACHAAGISGDCIVATDLGSLFAGIFLNYVDILTS